MDEICLTSKCNCLTCKGKSDGLNHCWLFNMKIINPGSHICTAYIHRDSDKDFPNVKTSSNGTKLADENYKM